MKTNLRPDHHYSGQNSDGFWERVSLIKGRKGDQMYMLGVVLQNLEEGVLEALERLEGKR